MLMKEYIGRRQFNHFSNSLSLFFIDQLSTPKFILQKRTTSLSLVGAKTSRYMSRKKQNTANGEYPFHLTNFNYSLTVML